MALNPNHIVKGGWVFDLDPGSNDYGGLKYVPSDPNKHYSPVVPIKTDQPHGSVYDPNHKSSAPAPKTSGGSGGGGGGGSFNPVSYNPSGGSAKLPAPNLNNPKISDYQVGMPGAEVDPKTWQPDGAFVENRLDGILASDSPLMTRAATQGMQFANSRGLLNSTMAAGAAQGAMIDRAMPIAQQDAQFVSDLNKMGMGYNQDLGKMSHGHNLGLASAEFTAKLDEDTKSKLMYLEAQYARILQYDNNAADAFKAGMGAIGMLNTNPDLSPEQQRAGTQQIVGMMTSHLNFLSRLYGG
jgi:hypothetical protein